MDRDREEGQITENEKEGEPERQKSGSDIAGNVGGDGSRARGGRGRNIGCEPEIKRIGGQSEYRGIITSEQSEREGDCRSGGRRRCIGRGSVVKKVAEEEAEAKVETETGTIAGEAEADAKAEAKLRVERKAEAEE